MKYLKDIETLEELKKQYHKWAMQLHPDLGGDDEAMKLLNHEYESLFDQVKDKHINKEGETYQKATSETKEMFTNIINALVKMNGIHIEIIGCFIWVTGNTKPHKEALKALGMKWHYKKQCWFLSPEGYRRFGKKEYSMNEIRSMYGVEYSENVRLREIREG